MFHRFLYYGAFLWICALEIATGQQLSYVLEMPAPHTHYFKVTMNLNGASGEYVDFKMATWAPGSYLIREFSRNVEEFAASRGRDILDHQKIDKNTWRVFYEGAGPVQVEYRVYAFEMSVRTSFLDSDHGYVNGSSVFMYPDQKLDLASTLTIHPFDGWEVVTTALEPVESPFKFKSPDYHTLVDSPIEIGNHEVHHFAAAGTDHTVAIYGSGNYQIDKLLRDMASVVEETTRVFGENPNSEFTFLIHNLDRPSGGLEHFNSTTLQVHRWTYQPHQKYLRFLSLVAHEYFHLWNVKRLRPRIFIPYDYDKENYTRLLWVMEGFTDYYDLLLVRSAGFMDENLFLSKLGAMINTVENRPGNKVQSVTDASFDAWIKTYRRDENSGNSSISYYSKGAVIGLILDLAILKSSQGAHSMDDLMRYLYRQYYEEQYFGLTEENMQRAVEKFLGQNPDQFFDQYVYGTDRLEYEEHLEYVGLNLTNQSDTSRINLGIHFEPGVNLRVSEVVRGTSAYLGGINVGDEIIALDGYRVRDSNLGTILDNKIAGDSIEVDLVRDGRLRTLQLRTLADRTFDYVVTQIDKPNQEQKKLYRLWLRNQ